MSEDHSLSDTIAPVKPSEGLDKETPHKKRKPWSLSRPSSQSYHLNELASDFNPRYASCETVVVGDSGGGGGLNPKNRGPCLSTISNLERIIFISSYRRLGGKDTNGELEESMTFVTGAHEGNNEIVDHSSLPIKNAHISNSDEKHVSSSGTRKQDQIKATNHGMTVTMLQGNGSQEPPNDPPRQFYSRSNLSSMQIPISKEDHQKKKRSKCCTGCHWWTCLSRCLTCWATSYCLSKCGGKIDPQMQQAWREKMALCLLIFVSCVALGFLTFGMTTVVCRADSFVIKHSKVVRMNNTDSRWFIIHGYAYNLPEKYLPYPHKEGDPLKMFAGRDITVYFPFAPTCHAIGLEYQFDCKIPGIDYEYCHDTDLMAKLDKVGQVNWDWSEIENSSHLLAYNGIVLDIKYYLEQIPESMSNKPYGNYIDKVFRTSVGGDATRALSIIDKRVLRCLIENFGAGTLDVKSVGCIFSDIVLYLSLVAILAVVLVKFFLAIIFTCFFSKKLGDFQNQRKTKISNNMKSTASALDMQNQVDLTNSKTRLLYQSNTDTEKGGGYHYKPYKLPTNEMGNYSFNELNDFSLSKPSFDHYLSPSKTSMQLYNNLSQQDLFRSFDAFPSHASPLHKSSTIFHPPSTFSDVRPEIQESLNKIFEDYLPSTTLKLDSQVSPDVMYTLLVVTCYSEGESGLRSTIESLVETDYPDNQKLLFIVADGLITGSGNDKSTPQILIDMMEVDQKAGFLHGKPWSEWANIQSTHFSTTAEKQQASGHGGGGLPKYMSTVPEAQIGDWLPEAYSYVAIADGTKRHNMARVFAGYYVSKGHRVPALLVVKCGTPLEGYATKPGNRGKRDSQIILMSFLSKVLFDDRMSPLEYDMYIKIQYLLRITPDQFEVVLCVDADTVVEPDCLTHMTAVMKMDPLIMGLCGETKIANKSTSWVTKIQVFEYFISHHLNKAFESIFGGVTCLPGCFCMYRIKAPKGYSRYWVPILVSPNIVDLYSENVTDTLHKKNLLLLGEDRYLTTLMLKTFPKRKMMFVPAAACKTQVPEQFKVLLSQRRRWINSTVHNLFELVLVRDLCGTFCCSMQFIIFMELVGTLVLPAAIVFTGVLIVSSFIGDVQYIPLGLLFAILGLPAFLIFFTSRSLIYALYMICYLISLPIWNFILPVYSYWHFDDFSWGETRKVANSDPKEVHGKAEGKFDSSQILMKRWSDYEADCLKTLTNAIEQNHVH